MGWDGKGKGKNDEGAEGGDGRDGMRQTMRDICIENFDKKYISGKTFINPFTSGIPKVLLSPITGLFSVKIR